MIELADYLNVEGREVRLVERSPNPSPELPRIAALASWMSYRYEVGPGSVVDVEAEGWHGAIRWLGPVEERLLEGLVEMARALATGRLEWDTPATPALLEELPHPIALDVYVGPRCAYCPAIAAAALRFAVATPRVRLRIVRADLHPHANVRSTPTVLVDGRPAHRGAGIEYALAEAVLASTALPPGH